MDQVNIIWRSYHEDILARGYWDDGLLEDTFNRGDFVHHEIKAGDSVPDLEGGAVFIINGRTHVEDTDKINADIAKLKWCLFIVTGDEEASFPWREIKHPIMRMWVMLPRMNEHNDTEFKLPNGYRPTTHAMLKEIGFRSSKITDYMFVGQVNHERRNQCVDVAKQFQTIYPNSIIIETDGFGKEILPYDQYLTAMARTKIVLCPSGIESPDNFRLYEALEAGCIPVVDAFSTNLKTPGFWQYLLGHDIPFPILNYWDELPALLPTLLKEYPDNANKIFAWWQKKKREIYIKLIDDIKELSK